MYYVIWQKGLGYAIKDGIWVETLSRWVQYTQSQRSLSSTETAEPESDDTVEEKVDQHCLL